MTELGNHPRIIQFFAIVPDERNYQIMLVMEYMEGGSLADKLRDQKPLSENSVLKYFTQILEGVSYLHRKQIYHSHIKPANILFTVDDKLKISDFGIAVESQVQTKSSATSSNFQGDFHYMSFERLQGADPSDDIWSGEAIESQKQSDTDTASLFQGDFHYMSTERLNGAKRSATNDIWSVGATFVHMISGQPLNHLDTITQLILNISKYKIFIKGNPLNNYLETLNDNDFKKNVISKTLCIEPNRANGQQLLRILFHHSKRLPAEALMAARDKNPYISGMSYNSARDELFLADNANEVVRAMRVRDNAGDLRNVYRAPQATSLSVWSVCHTSDSDTLLVCSGERGVYWLVALRRNDSEWREAQREQTDGKREICCALSDSQVLIGESSSKQMELFRLESGPRISRVHRIHVPDEYYSFSATCGSDTLVAMSYPYSDQSVRVHRLRGDRLEELARIQLKWPSLLLWLTDRLLVADYNTGKQSHDVIELEVSGTRLERRRELMAISENIFVSSLCAMKDGLAIFDLNSRDILHYSLVSTRPLNH